MLSNYLQILQESLEQKIEILTAIEQRSIEQSDMIKNNIPFEEIDANMDEKAELIDKLERLDDGFDSLFQDIKQELEGHKQEYKEQIAAIQECIGHVMDKSASIEAIEARNKQAMEKRFSAERKQLNDRISTSNRVYDYYKTSNKLQAVGPQFLDKKK